MRDAIPGNKSLSCRATIIVPSKLFFTPSRTNSCPHWKYTTKRVINSAQCCERKGDMKVGPSLGAAHGRQPTASEVTACKERAEAE